MRAVNLLKSTPHYRKDAFNAGLKNAGFTVSESYHSPSVDDVLVIWNRFGQNERYASEYEKAGAKVIVAENGYTKGYALSLSQHHHGGLSKECGAVSGPYARGGHILICAQRGIGSRLMASPRRWAEDMREKIKTHRNIVIRTHPGKYPPKTSLDSDLEDCHACFIWSSACGVRALEKGIPVIYSAPKWIAEESAIRYNSSLDIENIPYKPQSLGLNRAYSNQFTAEQIAAGEPFREILCQKS